jgi:hypothetical protein
MTRLYAAAGWGMVLLGTGHMAATFRVFDTLSGSAIWFFSGGMTLVMTGALNLLNRAYGRIAPGLRRVCIGTNAMMIVFSFVSGVVMHASIAQFVMVLGLTGGAGALSLSRGALVPKGGPPV